MRIRVLSDLHLEVSPFDPPPVACDLVVLAGDIHPGPEGVRWAREVFPSTPVAYVAGNHEFWGGLFPDVLEEMRAAARGSNVHVLERDVLELGGFRVLGATLWTDFALAGEPERDAREAHGMPDFRRILHGSSGSSGSSGARRLRPRDTMRAHEESRAWLADQLARPGPPALVVTHHAPHRRSTDPRFATRRSCAAFTSHLEALILSAAPPLWVHGHLHWAFDYTVGATRVLCNPRGYPGEATGEAAGGFDPACVVELPG
jgi:hypothetical protein